MGTETTEAPIKPPGVRDLLDLDVEVAPHTLADVITKDPNPQKDPRREPFPFFDRVKGTQPGEAFFIEKLRKKPNRLFLSEAGDPKGMLEETGRHRRIVAMVVIKDRSKGILKPTAEDLSTLRTLNAGTGRVPRNAVLINAAIHRPYPQTEDLELLLMAEVRGRMKALTEREITQRDIEQASGLVRFQVNPNVAVQRLRERFQNVWEFAFVSSVVLNPEKAREEVRRFQNLAA